MSIEKQKLASELLYLASAIRSLETSSEKNRAMWQGEVNDRLEALALMINHDVLPSTDPAERADQVEQFNLGKIFRASGTF